LIVLTSDYAVLLAEELGFKPVVDDEAAFDIYAPFVLFTFSFYYNLFFFEAPLILIHILSRLALLS